MKWITVEGVATGRAEQQYYVANRGHGMILHISSPTPVQYYDDMLSPRYCLRACVFSALAAVDLSVEWLWEVQEKLLRHEYLVLLITVRPAASWYGMYLTAEGFS